MFYLATRPGSAFQCCKQDTAEALRVSLCIANNASNLACDINALKVAQAFRGQRRFNIAFDGSCYYRRERILATVFAQFTQRAAVLRTKAILRIGIWEPSLRGGEVYPSTRFAHHQSLIKIPSFILPKNTPSKQRSSCFKTVSSK